MKKAFSHSCAFLLALWFLTGCGDSSRDNAAGMQNIVIALEPDKDPDAMLADQEALRQFLEKASELPVDVIIPVSPTVIHEGLRNGTIDIAFVSATAGVRLANVDAAHVLLAAENRGRTSYESQWLGLKDSPYEQVSELAGQPIAFASRSSTSGFIIPVWDLYDQGLIDVEGGYEAFFGEGNVSFGIGYVSAVERVLDGSAEAAAVSYYVFEEDKHLSEEQRNRLKVIDTQGPVPTHVVVAATRLSEDSIDELRRVFLVMGEEAPELRDRIFGAPLVEVDEETHYSIIREALDLIEQIDP